MKNKKYHYIYSLVSFLASAIILSVALFVHSLFSDPGWVFNALAVGLTISLAAFFSFAAVCLTNRLSKKTKAELPKLFSGFTAIILALLFVFGAAGQIVYSVGTETYEEQVGEREEKETVKQSENADIVLLLDDSGSMHKNQIDTVFREGCKEIIDQVSENCRMGCGIFTGYIEDENFSDLAPMNSDNKADLKKIIERIIWKIDYSKSPPYYPSSSSPYVNPKSVDNNFNGALERAYEMLTADRDSERHRIIVMFTDGIDQGSDKSFLFTESQNEKLLNEGIEVYSVRPTVNSHMCSQVFIDLVTEKGAHPERDNIVPINEGKLDLSGVIDALNEVTNKQEEKVTVIPIYEERTDIVFSKGLILYDAYDRQTPYRLVVRLCFFIVYSILIQLLCFRRLRLSSAALSICSSAAAWLSVWLSAVVTNAVPAVLGMALFMFTIFAFNKSNDN